MSDQNTLHQIFISKLEQHYGKYCSERNQFESTSNSKIARDLFYSDSQFSRLINNTASERELVRAVDNVQRLLEVHALKKKIKKLDASGTKKPKWTFGIGIAVLFLALLSLVRYYQWKLSEAPVGFTVKNSRYDMLKWSFENNYIRPYITLKKLPEDCNFPCYKYQGKWQLKSEYKIPFYRERNGFHYVAKQVIMYATAKDKAGNNGEQFDGYEYQKHEIWYDKREFPIDSFLVKGALTKVRPSYNNAILEKDTSFVKIAYVHTFFKTGFEIKDSLIYRTGQAIGRDLEFVAQDTLMRKLKSEQRIRDLKSEINSIAQNRLEDFSKPIICLPARVPNLDFNLIKQGDEMSFQCHFSTGRFLVNYTKIYFLDNQYINNYCR